VEGHTLGPKPSQRPSPPIWVAAVRTEETYAWAGANEFDLLTAPFFFPDHRDQQRLLGVYRDNLLTRGHDPTQKQIMAVYHMYCGSTEADIARVADPALRRYQTFTKATDLKRQAYRDPIAYKDWKGFFENRETITLEQMKASRAVIGQPDECIEKVALLSERFGVNYLCFEVNFGALPHDRVMESLERFAATVMRHFD
jgi:alkanesulfonate monooxygenase SsuD/methylene tetrahydromethanopterin reductase-like flavin-dependent oxidoreductase (luciferase family)